jgi:HAD superfamily hydrolase (TIGR01509 family)
MSAAGGGATGEGTAGIGVTGEGVIGQGATGQGMTGGSVTGEGAIVEGRHAQPDGLLICDCDGVLIDSEAVAADVLVRELEARWPGLDLRPIVLPLLGLRIERVLAGASAATGRALSAADANAIRRAVEVAAVEAPAVDGIDAALDAVGLTIACASNSYRAYVEAALARTGLKRFFGDRIFCADSVAHPKPAPDVYLAAARTLGVSPAQCLVVEDSVTGITAAAAAGMTVLGFAGAGHATPAQIDALRGIGARHVFDDMHELPGYVARWRATGAVLPT